MAEQVIPLNIKTKCLFSALAEHVFLFIGILGFFASGVLLIYVGWTDDEGIVFLPVFAGCVFTCVSFFIVKLSGLSSIRYYYNKKLCELCGIDFRAVITDKREEVNSYIEEVDGRKIEKEEVFYFVGFKYQYKGEHSSEFVLDSETLYSKLSEGDNLPIKVLQSQPETAFPELVKLGKAYSLKEEACY
ncbi:hypothetical protein L1077_10925 [Pseudoalteromonas luteoviolacea]|uniref:hypothetical protein n=1 Tax=Pseudoalteromonas luteoviolacea TaxID=43657 RepID=UPI001F3E83E4|nr:hypothetical protein [Pseudoalteromonas luteoviolacea]MCF6439945.1 hypothetical protein [Pseudoalteromonas luteoviolacea]